MGKSLTMPGAAAPLFMEQALSEYLFFCLSLPKDPMIKRETSCPRCEQEVSLVYSKKGDAVRALFFGKRILFYYIFHDRAGASFSASLPMKEGCTVSFAACAAICSSWSITHSPVSSPFFPLSGRIVR